MSKAIQAVAVLILAVAGHSAVAYHLDDHTRIVTQAYSEFAACSPALATRLNAKDLVNADLEEDLDLFTKWLRFSHFYHPGKNLRMWRGDSAGRIEEIQPNLLQCRSSAGPLTSAETGDLGHAIHHLQDMSVPAHVVPVNHAAWDGFETYPVDGDISSEWSCAEALSSADADLLNSLNAAAEETLAAVDALRFEAVKSGTQEVRELSGRDFWMEAAGDGFGQYGIAGNSFGAKTISLRDGEYVVSETAFREFKRQQMKRAVRATLRALAWAFPQHSI